MAAPAADTAEDVWLVSVGGKSMVKGKTAGPAYHHARRAAEVALEKVGAEQVSGGLAGIDMVWRKGGVARNNNRQIRGFRQTTCPPLAPSRWPN